MTRYQWEEGDLAAADIHDATGRQHRRVLWIDTKTGQGEQLTLTDRGMIRRRIRIPAPVRVTFREPA